MSISYVLNGVSYTKSGTAGNPSGSAPTGATNIVQNGGGAMTTTNTPNAVYNTTDGTLTDYGKSIGATPMSGGQVLNASNVNTKPLQLPIQSAPLNQNSLIDANNLALANGTNYTYEAGKGFVPVKQDTNASDLATQRINSYLGLERPNAEKIYNESGAAQVDQARQQVQNYTGQLNSIIAKRDADQLSVTGQGRGIPEAIIGGQQAQISKEAAIQALPVQALLANAQGNLQLAQEHLDTTFKLRMADAQSQYDFKIKIIDSVFDAADKKEQRQLDDLRHTQDQNFTRTTDAINFAQNLSTKALENGDMQSAAKFAQIQQPDPSSPTFARDLKTYNSEVAKVQKMMKPDQLRQLQIEKARKDLMGGGDTVPTVKSINGVDSQWNPATQTWIPVPTGGTIGGNDAVIEPLKQKLNLINGILDTGSYTKVVGTTDIGRSPILSAWTGVAQNASASIQQLTNQETLSNLLTLKKAGGTLGALNESEGQMLRNAATKINAWEVKDPKTGLPTGRWNANEGDFKKELQRLRELTVKALKASNPTFNINDEEKQLISNYAGSSFSTPALLNPASYY